MCYNEARTSTKVEIGVEAVVVCLQVVFKQGRQLGSSSRQLLIHPLLSSSIWPQKVPKRDVLLLKCLLCKMQRALRSQQMIQAIYVLQPVNQAAHMSQETRPLV